MNRPTLTLLLLAPWLAMAQPAPVAAVPPSDCPVCPELALVPPGNFRMGSAPDVAELDPATGESPAISVTLTRPFQLARREVSVMEFRRFVEATGSEPPLGCRIWQGGQWVFDRDRSWRDPGFAQPPRDDDPVVCVNWDDARAYTEWLSKESGRRYRLPSESEWEYVARGGSSFPRFWAATDSDEGSPLTLACDFANVYDVSAVEAYRFPWPNASCNDRHPGVAPVASYKPNGFGIHDILGNVREWIQDCYTASYAGRPADGQAWIWQGGCELKGVRGGSWASRPRDVRGAARSAEADERRQSDLGFRVARDYD